ncbi:MAG: Flp1 family type IVb pilin [Blautia massiliensis (ex Durand et al. 2017)]
MIEPVFMRATREGVKIIVVLIGLVLIFKKQLVSLVNSLMEKVTNQSNTV